VLPPVADFWAALPEIFTWLMGGAEAPLRARIEPGSTETTIRSRVLPMPAGHQEGGRSGQTDHGPKECDGRAGRYRPRFHRQPVRAMLQYLLAAVAR